MHFIYCLVLISFTWLVHWEYWTFSVQNILYIEYFLYRLLRYRSDKKIWNGRRKWCLGNSVEVTSVKQYKRKLVQSLWQIISVFHLRRFLSVTFDFVLLTFVVDAQNDCPCPLLRITALYNLSVWMEHGSLYDMMHLSLSLSCDIVSLLSWWWPMSGPGWVRWWPLTWAPGPGGAGDCACALSTSGPGV